MHALQDVCCGEQSWVHLEDLWIEGGVADTLMKCLLSRVGERPQLRGGICRRCKLQHDENRHHDAWDVKPIAHC